LHEENFVQQNVVIEVQRTAGGQAENGDVGHETVLEMLIRQVRVHKPGTSALALKLHFSFTCSYWSSWEKNAAWQCRQCEEVRLSEDGPAHLRRREQGTHATVYN
jgi:hypothetical protein